MQVISKSRSEENQHRKSSNACSVSAVNQLASVRNLFLPNFLNLVFYTPDQTENICGSHKIGFGDWEAQSINIYFCIIRIHVIGYVDVRSQ